MQLELEDHFTRSLMASFNRLSNDRDFLQFDKIPYEIIPSIREHVQNSLFRLIGDSFLYQKVIDDICREKDWESFVFDGGYVTEFTPRRKDGCL